MSKWVLTLSLWLAAPLALAADAPAQAPTSASPAAPSGPVLKTIDIEWEPIEKAGGYEVRLMPKGGGKPIKFLTEEARISKDVPVGTYQMQIRTRAKDEDYFSDWSETVTIDVVAKEITPLKPTDNEVLKAEGPTKKAVEFEWKPVEGVKEYTLKVWNEERADKPWVFVTKATKKRLDVPPGEVYHWQVLFESASAVSYQQAPTTFTFTVLGEKLTTPEVGPVTVAPESLKIEWRESPGASTYSVKLFYRHLDETEWQPAETKDLENSEWVLTGAKRGAYKVQVTAKAARRTASDVAEHEFIVKPPADELKTVLRN